MNEAISEKKNKMRPNTNWQREEILEKTQSIHKVVINYFVSQRYKCPHSYVTEVKLQHSKLIIVFITCVELLVCVCVLFLVSWCVPCMQKKNNTENQRNSYAIYIYIHYYVIWWGLYAEYTRTVDASL